MGDYPGSIDWKIPATTYGPLPTHDRTKVALVLHTTETKSMPGFRDSTTAPHYVYDLQTRQWFKWAEYQDGYVGTLKGHKTGHYNCKAFQVEIIGYSAKYNKDGARLHPWIGDASDHNYQDLADFYRWSHDLPGIGFDVTPTPDNGWLYGTSSPYRMSEAEWERFSGLTAHGAVPGNTHWDTGVLDLRRIHALSIKEVIPMPPDDGTYRTVINVPDAQWARNVVDRMICEGIITEGDGSNWEKPLKNGTIWNYLHRFTDAINNDKIKDC